MKINMRICIYAPNFSTDTEYDDNLDEHTYRSFITGNIERRSGQTQPILDEKQINNRKYTISINPYTNRPTSAWTLDRDKNGDLDPRKFLIEQDYKDFLAGK